jgi:hypothetical protein
VYQNKHNYILGFHGCDKSIVEKIVNLEEDMKPSENAYDWLGFGLYFWENNEKRALEWAVKHKVKEPAVLGAIICLGNCCDFLDSEYLNLLHVAKEIIYKYVSAILMLLKGISFLELMTITGVECKCLSPSSRL